MCPSFCSRKPSLPVAASAILSNNFEESLQPCCSALLSSLAGQTVHGASPHNFTYQGPINSTGAAFSSMPYQSASTAMDFPTTAEDLAAFETVLETYTDWIRPSAKVPELSITTHDLPSLPNSSLPVRPRSSPCAFSPVSQGGPKAFDCWPSTLVHGYSSSTQGGLCAPNNHQVNFSQPAATASQGSTATATHFAAPVPLRPYPAPNASNNLATRAASRSNSRGKGASKQNKPKKLGTGIGSIKRQTIRRSGSFGPGHYRQPKTEDAIAKEKMAKFLLEVKVENDVPWKDVREAFLAKREEDCTVEQLQMRFTRFCRDTGLWTEEDNELLKQGKYNMTKFAIIKERMHDTQILSKLGNPYAPLPQVLSGPAMERTPSAEEAQCMAWIPSE
ncbi:hypothetical protein IWX92DRAFT_202721 [Phyllosticta citricarpa]